MKKTYIRYTLFNKIVILVLIALISTQFFHILSFEFILTNNYKNILKKDDKQIIEIRDNGGGVSEDIADKIFDPYFSTKLEKNRTGLGLYMSKTIIEEHCKGELKFKKDKKGAIFMIVLGKDIV